MFTFLNFCLRNRERNQKKQQTRVERDSFLHKCLKQNQNQIKKNPKKNNSLLFLYIFKNHKKTIKKLQYQNSNEIKIIEQRRRANQKYREAKQYSLFFVFLLFVALDCSICFSRHFDSDTE